MTDVPFIVLLADALLLLSGIFIATIWCPFVINLVNWYREPTLKNASLILFLLLIPLMVTWVFVSIFMPDALLWGSS